MSFLLILGLAGQARAWPADEKDWLACKKDADCTSVKLGCSYWQPVNKKYAKAMKEKYPVSCLQTLPAGPQPPPYCISHMCGKPKAKLLKKK